MTVAAQAPLPVRGPTRTGPAPGRQGQAPANLPRRTGRLADRGRFSTAVHRVRDEMFPALMSLPAGDDLAALQVRGDGVLSSAARPTAQPYKTRIVVRKPAGQQPLQRHRARRVDASERQCVDVSFHAHLHHDVRSHRRRNRDERSGAVRRIQRGALPRPAVISPGRRTRSSRRSARCCDRVRPTNPLDGLAGEKDDPRRDIGVRGGTGQLPAGAHGLPPGRHEADLRRLPADEQRRRTSARSTCR